MELIGVEGADSFVYEFRLTRAGRPGKLEDVELFFPGPWTAVHSTKRYDKLEEAAYELFGYWAAMSGVEASVESLQKALTPHDLYDNGYRVNHEKVLHLRCYARELTHCSPS